MADVFLSYNSEDRELVDALAEALRSRNVDVWYDVWRFPTGRPFPRELKSGLDQSGACAILFGPHGLGSWHALEADLALKMSVEGNGTGRSFGLIPVRLPGAPPWKELDLPPFLNLYEAVTLEADEPAGVERLVAAIRKLPPKPASSSQQAEPYVGLLPFSEQQESTFFGRDRYVLELLDAIKSAREPRWSTVLGASGSGKSSLLHAGVAPFLREWKDTIFVKVRPGQNASANLWPELRKIPALLPHIDLVPARPETRLYEVVKAALPTSGITRLVILLDQFEEIYTSRPTDPDLGRQYSSEVIDPFMSNLAYAVREPGGSVFVVCAMRRDFFEHAENDPHLGDIAKDVRKRVVLRPLSDRELRFAIEKPAHDRGVPLDRSLLETLVGDFALQPAGALPFLQEALLRVWKARNRYDGRMAFEEYERFGRLRGALNAHANSVFDSLEPEDQVRLRRTMVHLVRLGDEGSEDTKRRVPLDDLPGCASTLDLARWMAAQDQRILSLDRGADGGATIEISHEALISGWERLHEWIAEKRPERLRLRALEVEAKHWREGKQAIGLLLSRSEFRRAKKLTASFAAEVPPIVVKFMQASAKALSSKARGMAAVAVILLGGLALAATVVSPAKAIRAKGSGTFVDGILTPLRKDRSFMACVGVPIETVDSGSGQAMLLLAQDDTDLALMSRHPGLQSVAHDGGFANTTVIGVLVAVDEVAFVVNRDNPLRKIQIDDLQRVLFVSPATQIPAHVTWGTLGLEPSEGLANRDVHVFISRPGESGTRLLVQDVLKPFGDWVIPDFPDRELGPAHIPGMVANATDGLGVVSLALSRRNKSVSELTLEQDGALERIRRGLWVFAKTNRELGLRQDVCRMISCLLSQATQSNLSALGLSPIPEDVLTRERETFGLADQSCHVRTPARVRGGQPSAPGVLVQVDAIPADLADTAKPRFLRR